LTTYNSNNDLPTTIDLSLGTEHFVEKLALDISNSKPPKTFSITGYWGSGKTSALAMLCKKLTNKNPLDINHENSDESENCIGIWFEAWRYQHEPLPIVALLQEIKKSFSTSNKFINSAGKLASVGFLGALTVLDGVIKSATGMSGLSKIKGIGESYEKENLLNRLSSDHINDALKQAIDTLLSNNDTQEGHNSKLVIFIDDLDRCEPEMAIKLLEGLKLYLNIPNCVVVMAIDSHQIESNILKKIDDIDCYNRFQGVEYMEKLCQDSHRLPVPNTKQRNEFLIESLRPLINDFNSVDQEVLEDLESGINKYDCLPANPRRLKMLVNRMASFVRYVKIEDISLITTFCSANNITEKKRDELFALGVLIVSSLSVNYRRLYERLEKSPLFIMELFQFCNQTNPESYNDKQSVFYEFQNVNATTHTIVEHPSDLGVFRLTSIFNEARNSIRDEYEVTPPIFGDMLHQIIEKYNTPRAQINHP
jgi:hypothetical protein